MNEFRFLNYCTKYSIKGDINKQLREEACFSKVFNKVINNNHNIYTIYIYTKLSGTSNNLCLLNKLSVKNHINQLKSLFPIKSRVIQKQNDIIVTLEIKDCPATFHKYALTWVRYLYEYPYNVLLQDAYLLKKEKRFRYTSILNLLNLCIGTAPIQNMRDIHSCIKDHHLVAKITYKKLKQRIKLVKELHYLYDSCRSPYNKYSGDYYALNYWTDPEIYETVRKPVYLTNANLIKI